MNNYYNSTPYRLNLKLKKLNRNLSQDFDINRLYNNLNESMPLITNQFCSLKNRTKILNKALNKIPKINIETESSYYTNLSRSILTSPIKTKSTLSLKGSQTRVPGMRICCSSNILKIL